MSSKGKTLSIVVNGIFIIVLIICVFCLLLSFMCFSINLTSTSKSIKNVSDEIISSISNDNSYVFNNIENEKGNNNENSDFNSFQKLDIQSEINYLERLKEIESTSVSVNLLTFLYTFLSSVLIGIGTYFMKKNVENTNIIKESKDYIEKNKKEIQNCSNEIEEIKKAVDFCSKQILDINNSIDLSSICLHLQKISMNASNISFAVNFDSKMSSVVSETFDKGIYNKLIYICLPQLNEAMNDMLACCKNLQINTTALYKIQLDNIRKELGDISIMIKSWKTEPKLINDKVKERLQGEVKEMLALLEIK